MTTISVSLTDEQIVRLKERAQRVGVTPEELVRAGLEEWLDRPHEDFRRAANEVLRKNAELYRRLAQ